MMKAARTSETWVNFYPTTRYSNPEDSHLHTHRCENLILPEGKRPLERPRRRWEDAIKMYLEGIGLNGVDWFHLA
jgi:hypothetical protein